MSILENSKRIKGTFKVDNVTYNNWSGRAEYRLVDISTGELYRNGAHVRDIDLIPSKSFAVTPTRGIAESSTGTSNGFEREEIKCLRLGGLVHGLAKYETPASNDNVQSGSLQHAASAAGVQSFVDPVYASEDKQLSVSDNPAFQRDRPGQAMDETRSVYSDVSSVASSFKNLYIAEIAADILEHISVEVVSSQDGSMEELYKQLPRLLKGFAIDLASVGRTQESRDAMVFISKYRQWVHRKKSFVLWYAS